MPQVEKKEKNQPKIVNMSLPISFSICFRCSKGPSHRDGSFGYQQHLFWLRNKKIIFCYARLTNGLIMQSNIKDCVEAIIMAVMGCIEISVQRITVWYHKACLMMTTLIVLLMSCDC